MDRGVSHDDLKTNTPICDSYVSAMRAMGHITQFDNSGQTSGLAGGSTDMGIATSIISYLTQSRANILQGMSHMPSLVSMASSVFLQMEWIILLSSLAVLALKNPTNGVFTVPLEWQLLPVRYWRMMNLRRKLGRILRRSNKLLYIEKCFDHSLVFSNFHVYACIEKWWP